MVSLLGLSVDLLPVVFSKINLCRGNWLAKNGPPHNWIWFPLSQTLKLAGFVHGMSTKTATYQESHTYITYWRDPKTFQIQVSKHQWKKRWTKSEAHDGGISWFFPPPLLSALRASSAPPYPASAWLLHPSHFTTLPGLRNLDTAKQTPRILTKFIQDLRQKEASKFTRREMNMEILPSNQHLPKHTLFVFNFRSPLSALVPQHA